MFFLFVTFSRHLLLHLASFWEACFACFLTEVFFSRSRVLFTRPSSTIFSEKNFKTRFHGTIHTFKIYFITVFSIFRNKRYPNRFLFNFSLFISSIKWRSIQPSFSFAKPNWSNAIRSTTMPLLTSGSWVFFFFFFFLFPFFFFFKWKNCRRNHFGPKYIFRLKWLKWRVPSEMVRYLQRDEAGGFFVQKWVLEWKILADTKWYWLPWFYVFLIHPQLTKLCLEKFLIESQSIKFHEFWILIKPPKLAHALEFEPRLQSI